MLILALLCTIEEVRCAGRPKNVLAKTTELPVLRESLDCDQRTKLRHWPTPQEYNEAIQVPQQSFGDLSLRCGSPQLNALGLPRPITGMFASVYRLTCPDGDWAVRCFLHNFSDQAQRYELLYRYLSGLDLPFMVGFQYLEQGIFCQGRWYPILKMPWCQGQTLNSWIEANLARPESLKGMAEKWRALLADLRRHGIAHGDLQHGNVLVHNGELKLVDYDGMYIPSLSGFASNEMGHRHYQHPGRSESDFAPWLDNFSSWLIYLSLKCLARDPMLWHQLRAGDEFLLLSRTDLENPNESAAFYLLERHHAEEVQEYSRLLRLLLLLPVEKLPDLDSCPVVPQDLPPVSLPVPEVLPAWVRDHEEKVDQSREFVVVAEADEHLEEDDAIGRFGRRQRKRSRSKGGSRGGYWSSGRGNAKAAPALPAGSNIDLADWGGTASGNAAVSIVAATPGSTSCARAYAKLCEAEPPKAFGWHGSLPVWKIILTGLALVLSILIVMLQIGERLSADESASAAFPVLVFDSSGEANLLQQAAEKYKSGDLDGAVALYEHLIDQLTAQMDAWPNSPGRYAVQPSRLVLVRNLARAYDGLGDTCYAQESFEDALAEYQSALDTWQEVAGDQNSRPAALSLYHRALSHFALGNQVDCVADFQAAVDIFNRYPSQWDDHRKQCLSDFASVLAGKNDTAAAQKLEKQIANFPKPQGGIAKSKLGRPEKQRRSN